MTSRPARHTRPPYHGRHRAARPGHPGLLVLLLRQLTANYLSWRESRPRPARQVALEAHREQDAELMGGWRV